VEYRQLVRLSHGEVEDYSIEIIDGNGNTNPPSKPTNLAASELQHHQQIYLECSTDDEAVTAYYVYNGEEIITAVSGTSYTVTGLNSNTIHFYSEGKMPQVIYQMLVMQ
jgi:hypothetical protein